MVDETDMLYMHNNKDMTHDILTAPSQEAAKCRDGMASAACAYHVDLEDLRSRSKELLPESDAAKMHEDDGEIVGATRLCPQCGTLPVRGSLHFKLCERCRDDRLAVLDALKKKVRRRFCLKRSPQMRSCMLNLLLLGSIDLQEPEGWRAGHALVSEVKAAGFLSGEAEKMLNQAGGKEKMVGLLTEKIYRASRVPHGGWSCRQLRDLEVDCNGCADQFAERPRDKITESFQDASIRDLRVK